MSKPPCPVVKGYIKRPRCAFRLNVYLYGVTDAERNRDYHYGAHLCRIVAQQRSTSGGLKALSVLVIPPLLTPIMESSNQAL
jgi:hypothetical protein